MKLLSFLDRFSGTNAQISNFIKIRGSRVVPCGRTEGRTYRQTDGRTDGHDEADSQLFAILRTRLKRKEKSRNDRSMCLPMWTVLNPRNTCPKLTVALWHRKCFVLTLYLTNCCLLVPDTRSAPTFYVIAV